ncbi:MAG: hypothetical protein U1E50_14285 [Caulobacteraceae bacterium]
MPNEKFASIKVSRAFVEEARREAELLNRSLASQIEHWAKLGRAFENTPGVGIDRVRAALEGKQPLQGLTDGEQDQYYDLLTDSFENPSKDVREAYALLGEEEAAFKAAKRTGGAPRKRRPKAA